MSNSTPTILQKWLHPLGLKEFMDRHWTHQSYWANAGSERLQLTRDLLPDLDLSNLLDYAKDPIKAWYLDNNKPVYTLALGRKEAFHAYRAGLTLYFQLDLSLSARLTTELSHQLARAPQTISVSIFASREGSRTLPHVDGNENFTLQLQGTKRWKISPGIDWPGLQEKSQNQSVVGDLFRIRRPPETWSDVTPLQMTPGTFLYFPAKFWHTVETIEDSLSLNVSITTTYTWADVLLPAIRTALMRKKHWRNCEVGLWSSGNQRKQAEKTLSELLKKLSEDLRDIESDDVLAAWNAAEELPFPEAAPANFVRNPFIFCVIVSATVDVEFQLRVEPMVRRSKSHVLTFPWKFYAPFLKLASEPVVRSAADFQDVAELVSGLLRYGVLRPCEPNI
jgi:hypothetical protein